MRLFDGARYGLKHKTKANLGSEMFPLCCILTVDHACCIKLLIAHLNFVLPFDVHGVGMVHSKKVGAFVNDRDGVVCRKVLKLRRVWTAEAKAAAWTVKQSHGIFL